MSKATTWLAEYDGRRYRVRTVSTVDRGQYIKVEQWADAVGHWTLVPWLEQVRTIPELAKYIDLSQLREIDERADL